MPEIGGDLSWLRILLSGWDAGQVANRRLQDVQERLPVAPASPQPIPPRSLRRRRRRGGGQRGQQERQSKGRVGSLQIGFNMRFFRLVLSTPPVRLSAGSGTSWRRSCAVWPPGGETSEKPCCFVSTTQKQPRRLWNVSQSLSPSSKPLFPRR